MQRAAGLQNPESMRWPMKPHVYEQEAIPVHIQMADSNLTIIAEEQVLGVSWSFWQNVQE